MKKIRLEIPLDIWKEAIDNRIWLKIKNGRTEPYKDMKCTIPITQKGKKCPLEVEIPEELNLIEVIGFGGLTPGEDIYIGWILDSTNPNWRIPGLRQVMVVMENLIHEVPVIDEKPDIAEWKKYYEEAEDGWLFLKTWAMEVYILEKQTVASFHWHPNLKEQYLRRLREITLSKKHRLPCMWEKGGCDLAQGSATIICDKDGEKKKAIYIRRKGKLACSEHALIVVQENDVLVEITCEYNNLNISINKIVSLSIEEECAEVECIARYLKGFFMMTRNNVQEFHNLNWKNPETAKKYKNAILAAYDKAMCMDCSQPYFVRN